MLTNFLYITLVGYIATGISAAPVVDLGYGLWQATLNETGHYYNFSNIRYAQPPVGALRFAAPKEPLVNRTVINDGQDGRICIQAEVSWAQERSLYTKAYFSGAGISTFQYTPPPGSVDKSKPPSQTDGRATEDCLFLDVLVPKCIFENETMKGNGGAPVMMWTYGGGFYEGYKDSQGNAAGLLARSMANPTTAPGIVYVAINYRLGAFGWLSGPSFTSSGGLPNAGFYDQRLALEWIQKNIHRFGGDPNKVTMMGESAGASSTLHQMTAFGGAKGDAPFQQGIMISPAFKPNPYNIEQEQTYQKFLTAANVSTLAELKTLSPEAIVAANSLTVFQAPYGSAGGYGPAVDGNFVPQLPTLLLQQGRYSKNIVSVLAAHNADEGFLFTDPAIQNNTAFNAFVNSSNSPLFPDAQPAIKNEIASTLYPPVYDNEALGYNNTFFRTAALLSDLLVTCNVQAVLETWDVNKTHAWLFAEGEGLHGEDNPYVFYNNGPARDAYGFGSVNETVAKTMQTWMLNFGVAGSPNGPGVPSLPVYGPNHTLASLSNRGLAVPVPDPALSQRCDFFRQALYF